MCDRSCSRRPEIPASRLSRLARLFAAIALLFAAIAGAALGLAAFDARASERRLEGVGPEGERVAVALSRPSGDCPGRGETDAVGRWPDGRVLEGCAAPRYSVDDPVLVRWREVVDGRPVERTVDYSRSRLSVTRVRP